MQIINGTGGSPAINGIVAVVSGDTDLSGVTAGAGDVLAGKIIVNALGAEVEGTMPDNADADVEVTTVAGTTIPAGKYDGTGKAILSAAEAAKVIAGNIKDGVTLLGVEGSHAGLPSGNQAWTTYPNSPEPTAYGLYQCIVGNDDGKNLLVSGSPFYNPGDDTLYTSRKPNMVAIYLLTNNVWVYNREQANLWLPYHNGTIEQSNNNIYTSAALSTVHFSKTTA